VRGNRSHGGRNSQRWARTPDQGTKAPKAYKVLSKMVYILVMDMPYVDLGIESSLKTGGKFNFSGLRKVSLLPKQCLLNKDPFLL
jgi:hypothetical protein